MLYGGPRLNLIYISALQHRGKWRGARGRASEEDERDEGKRSGDTSGAPVSRYTRAASARDLSARSLAFPSAGLMRLRDSLIDENVATRYLCAIDGELSRNAADSWHATKADAIGNNLES